MRSSTSPSSPTTPRGAHRTRRRGDARWRRRARRGAATCSRTCRPPTPCRTSNGSGSRWATIGCRSSATPTARSSARATPTRTPSACAPSCSTARSTRPSSATQVTLGQARGFERALDDFLADCSSHPGCAFHHDGDAATALRRAPGPGRAAPRWPRSDPDGRRLNQTRFDAAVLQELYQGRPAWPAARRRPRRGRRRRRVDAARGWPTRSSGATATVATTTRSRRSGRSPASTARWSVTSPPPPRSSIGPWRWRPASARSSSTTACPCSVWPVPPGRRAGRLTAAGAPPILVVGTTRDPATPLVQAQSAGRATRPGPPARGRRRAAHRVRHRATVRRPRGDALPRRAAGPADAARGAELGSRLPDHPDLFGGPPPCPTRGRSRRSVVLRVLRCAQLDQVVDHEPVRAGSSRIQSPYGSWKSTVPSPSPSSNRRIPK